MSENTTPLKFDAATVNLLLQILLQFGPAAYAAILEIFKKPADQVTAADFDALTAIVNQPLHQ
jgi:hypothetical protein